MLILVRPHKTFYASGSPRNFLLSERRRQIRQVAVLGVSIGLPLNLFFALSILWDLAGVTYLFPLGAEARLIGAPLLAIEYMASAALLAQHFPVAALTRRLAVVGRMTPTNYLAQSIIVTAISRAWRSTGSWGYLGSGAASPTTGAPI